ncbi:hypothetical protein PUN28_019377 [Cardiocondyla obscurior]|uniref:Uncharacterized protein n=1 Tax=Cardiocondyla obscurior TaxID=286306 RepID=A0AAW2EF41_9HYME
MCTHREPNSESRSPRVQIQRLVRVKPALRLPSDRTSIRRQPKRWLHTDEPLYLDAWRPRFPVGLSAFSYQLIVVEH